MKQNFFLLTLVLTAFGYSFSPSEIAFAGQGETGSKAAPGAISLATSPIYSIPCSGPNSSAVVKLWSEPPVNDKGENNPKAVATDVNCRDLETLDAENKVVYSTTVKPDKNGYGRVKYLSQGKWKEAVIQFDGYTRYDSLCDYTFQKNNFLKELEQISKENDKAAYERQRQEAERKAKDFSAYTNNMIQHSCSKDSRYGYYGRPDYKPEPPQSVGYQPKYDSEPEAKICAYSNHNILNTYSSGRCLAQRIATAKNRDEEFLKALGGAALQIEKVHGIPAEMFLAKIQIEAATATSPLFVQNNNFGGIGYLHGGSFTTEALGLDGKKRPLKITSRGGFFDFASLADAIDYYAHMMLYQPETASTYYSFRSTVCSNMNARLDDKNVKPVSGATTAMLLGNYSELGSAYNSTMSHHIRTTQSIRTFKDKYMICDGDDPELVKFFDSCAKGQVKEPAYTSEQPNTKSVPPSAADRREL